MNSFLNIKTITYKISTSNVLLQSNHSFSKISRTATFNTQLNNYSKQKLTKKLKKENKLKISDHVKFIGEEKFESNLNEVKEKVIQAYRARKASNLNESIAKTNSESLLRTNQIVHLESLESTHNIYTHPYFTITEEEHAEMAKEIEAIEAERVRRGEQWEQDRLQRSIESKKHFADLEKEQTKNLSA